MNLLEQFHDRKIHTRRAQVLSDLIATCLPPNVSVLDVGGGDGLVASRIQQKRDDVKISGVDVLVREQTHIPMAQFDGEHIPLGDNETDVVMFIDVLHHTDNPMTLLREAVRTARVGLIIKDHLCPGFLARSTLRFMDRVSNAHHGIVLPYNYWTPERWRAAFDELGLQPNQWIDQIDLYPAPFNWVFGRGLHFVTRLDCEVPAA